VRHFVIALSLSAAGWTVCAGSRPAAAQPPLVRASQGVYTKAQAGRGSRTYAGICVDCHTLGRFRGPDFAAKWADKPLAALHKAVKSMPQGEPGSLDPQDYIDVVAYLLSINGYSDGSQELPPSDEAVAAIWLDARAP
jgi:mono/diheme cytochrome c family protein